MNNETRMHTQKHLDNEFSRAYQYVQTLNAFKSIHHRNPKPQVFRVDREFWKALVETRGQTYADDFEAWLCS